MPIVSKMMSFLFCHFTFQQESHWQNLWDELLDCVSGFHVFDSLSPLKSPSVLTLRLRTLWPHQGPVPLTITMSRSPSSPFLRRDLFFFSLQIVYLLSLTSLSWISQIILWFFIWIPFRASHLRKMCLMVCLFLLHGLSVLTAESTLSWSTVLLRAPIHSWEGQNCVWASSQTLSVEAPFLSNSNRRARPALLARDIDQP